MNPNRKPRVHGGDGSNEWVMDSHLMFDPQVLLTRCTPEEGIDILERQFRSLRNPICCP